MEGLIKCNWRTVQVGSPLFDTAKEALEFGKKGSAWEVVTRDDYRISSALCLPQSKANIGIESTVSI
jgi:hypothetical protein